MTAGAVLSVVGSLAVAFVALAGAVYTTRSGGRQSPYESIAERVTTLERQHDEDRKLIKLLHEDGEAKTTKIAGLERKVGAVIADRDDVVAFLMVWREWVAMGSVPPAPRIPVHLRDVIPDWDPSDADRAQDDGLRAQRSKNDPTDPVGP